MCLPQNMCSPKGINLPFCMLFIIFYIFLFLQNLALPHNWKAVLSNLKMLEFSCEIKFNI